MSPNGDVMNLMSNECENIGFELETRSWNEGYNFMLEK